MNRKIVKWRRFFYFLGIGIGGSLLFLQLFTAVKSLIQNKIIYSSPYLLFGLLPIGLLAINFQIAAWLLIMRGLGIDLPFRAAAAGYITSFIPRYIPGTIWGYWGRNEWLFQVRKVPGSVSNIGSVLEILSSLTAITLIIGYYLSSTLDGISRFAAIVFISALPLLIWLLINKTLDRPIIKNYLIKNSKEFQIKKLKIWTWLGSTVCFLIIWLLYGAITIIVLFSALLHPEFNFSSLLKLSSLYSFSWLVGFLILFIPSGLGIRETVFISLLSVLHGIDYSLATVTALFTRVALLGSELLYFWIVNMIQKFSKQN